MKAANGLVMAMLWVFALASTSAMSASDHVTALRSDDRPGHYLTWKGKPRLLIGDSVTQGWMECGENLDQRAYVDALAAKPLDHPPHSLLA